jgi:hypothetical protein
MPVHPVGAHRISQRKVTQVAAAHVLRRGDVFGFLPTGRIKHKASHDLRKGQEISRRNFKRDSFRQVLGGSGKCIKVSP